MRFNLKKSRGITLIEVLVAVIVLAFGLLGLAGLQTVGLRNNDGALRRSHATFLAQDITDRMRINMSATLNGDYDLALGAAAPGNGTVAEKDLTAWLSTISQQLPSGGVGAVDCYAAVNSTVNDICEVTVRWDDSRGLYTGNACDTNDPACFVMSTEL
ncbi:MAG: type IV pilus modification protein PilV [Chromatiales bacterium]|jgi:type IV pilus assembly protein PilV